MSEADYQATNQQKTKTVAELGLAAAVLSGALLPAVPALASFIAQGDALALSTKLTEIFGGWISGIVGNWFSKVLLAGEATTEEELAARLEQQMRQDKAFRQAVFARLDQQSQQDEAFRKQFKHLLRQLASVNQASGRQVKAEIARLSEEVQALKGLFSQASTTTINTAGGANISGSDFQAWLQVFGGTVYLNGAPVTADEQKKLLKNYLERLRSNCNEVTLFHDHTVAIDAAYVQLQAARRYEARLVRQQFAERRRELEEKWRKNEQADERTIQERLYDHDFFFAAGLELGESCSDLHDVVASHPRLVILGEPGSGKTTILRYLAYHFSHEQPQLGKHDVAARVPLYVKLTDIALNQQGRYDVDHLIQAAVPDTLPQRDRFAAVLTEYVHDGKVIFLLDGLDEVAASQRGELAEFLSDLAKGCQPINKQGQAAISEVGNNRLLVTCRVANYDSAPLTGAITHYSVLRLEREQQRGFLERWFAAWADREGLSTEWVKEQAEALYQQLERPGLQRLAQVPLLLSLTAYVWQTAAQQLPETRAGLYWEAVGLLLKWRGKEVKGHPTPERRRKEVHQKLGELAYAMLVNRPRGIFDSTEAADFLGNDWQQLWQEQGGGLLMTRGLINSVRSSTDELNPDDYWFGFPHLSFAEYFAGCYLVSGTLEEAKQRIHRHLHDDRWQEAILLGLGYLQATSPKPKQGAASPAGQLVYDLCLDPQRTASDYDDLLHRDLLFALRATGEGIVLQEGEAKGCYTNIVKFSCHGDKLLFNQMSGINLRMDFCSVFARLSRSEVAKVLVPLFLTKLSNENSEVRSRAATALGLLDQANTAVVARLINLFTDDSHVASSARLSMGKLVRNNKQALTMIVNLLASESASVRTSAVVALGVSGQADDQMVSKILTVLKDNSAQVRGEAADALKRLGRSNNDVITTLLESVEDESYMVRGHAINALRKLGDCRKEVVEALITALQDSHDYVQWRAAEALGELRCASNPVIEKLLLALHDKAHVVRMSAAAALGDLGQATIEVSAGLAALKYDENDSVRQVATSSLYKLCQVNENDMDKVREEVKRHNESTNPYRDYKELIRTAQLHMNKAKKNTRRVYRMLRPNDLIGIIRRLGNRKMLFFNDDLALTALTALSAVVARHHSDTHPDPIAAKLPPLDEDA